MEAAANRSATTHNNNIALLPPPGFLGHLIPFIELAKKLVLHHSCTVTLIIPNDGSPMQPQRSLLEGIPTAINTVFLPPTPVDDDNLPENSNPETLMPTLVSRSLPALRDTLSSLRDTGNPAAALVVDLFAPYAIDVAREFRIPAYIFYVIPATELSLSMDLPRLEASNSLSEPIELPGPIVLNAEDFPDPMKDSSSEDYKSNISVGQK